MSKTAVVFKSKYGSTKKYANWIADDLNADTFEAKKVSINKLKEYDTIIYGGSLFATKVKGFDIIKKNYKKLNDKKILLFSVGLATPTDEVVNQLKDTNLTEEMKGKVPLFMLRGGMDYSKLNWLDKKAMGIMKNMLLKKKPEELTKDDKELLDTYGKAVDFTDKKTIKSIIEAALN